MTLYLTIAFLSAIFEGFIGFPEWLYKKISHPVVWVGAGINFADNKFNKGTPNSRKINGFILGILLLIIPFCIGLIIEKLIFGALPNIIGIIAIAIIATHLIAQNSLYKHTNNVLLALKENNIDKARTEVAKIVGRDTQNLDSKGIARAAIETLSESFCDGVIAPLFWLCIFGLGGGMAFKAISTADSMIGHKDDKYIDFGMPSARIDDVMNFIPARISGLLICIIGGNFKIMLRDNNKHQSPNAAWSEAAMAGALGCKLGGGSYYDGEFIQRPTLGDGDEPDIKDLAKAMNIYILACVLSILIIGSILLIGGSAWALR